MATAKKSSDKRQYTAREYAYAILCAVGLCIDRLEANANESGQMWSEDKIEGYKKGVEDMQAFIAATLSDPR